MKVRALADVRAASSAAQPRAEGMPAPWLNRSLAGNDEGIMRVSNESKQSAPVAATGDQAWRLISAGALPPATTIEKHGAPCWSLSALLEWTGIPLDVVVSALAPIAATKAADQARARQPLAGPDLGYGAISWQHKKSPTPSKPRPLRIKPARQG